MWRGQGMHFYRVSTHCRWCWLFGVTYRRHVLRIRYNQQIIHSCRAWRGWTSPLDKFLSLIVTVNLIIVYSPDFSTSQFLDTVRSTQVSQRRTPPNVAGDRLIDSWRPTDVMQRRRALASEEVARVGRTQVLFVELPADAWLRSARRVAPHSRRVSHWLDLSWRIDFDRRRHWRVYTHTTQNLILVQYGY